MTTMYRERDRSSCCASFHLAVVIECRESKLYAPRHKLPRRNPLPDSWRITSCVILERWIIGGNGGGASEMLIGTDKVTDKRA